MRVFKKRGDLLKWIHNNSRAKNLAVVIMYLID